MKLEHIGIAVKNLETSNELFTDLFGAPPYKTEEVETEGVKTSFFKLGSSKVELLEASKRESPIAKFIERSGEGIHHLAFEVKNLKKELNRLEKKGFVLIGKQIKKGADNKWVAFLHPKSTNSVLIELCQTIEPKPKTNEGWPHKINAFQKQQNSMSTAKNKGYKRITTKTLTEMKSRAEKIAMLTAYDYTMAKIIDRSGIDVILVGDSASNVIAGHETTLPITLDQMIYHASSVVRGIDRALVVVDLPFGTYQSDPKEALRSAIRIMKESGAHAIKMEGGQEIKESVKRILKAGIPVMGHLGLTPQSIYKFGTYTVRAKEKAEAEKLIKDAKLLESMGCFGIVLEKVPASLARGVAHILSIPIIGIGAGNGVDGQVLVSHDMLGMTHEFNPRFLRRYLNLYEDMSSAFKKYIKEVKAVTFPADTEQYWAAFSWINRKRFDTFS